MNNLITKHLKDNSNASKITHLEKDLATFDRALSNLSKEREKAIQLAIKGLIKESDIQPEIERIDRELLDLKIKTNNTKEQLESYSQVGNKVVEISTDLKQIKKNTAFNDKRDIVRKYIKSITISYKDDWYSLDIEFNITGMPMEKYEIDKLYKLAIQVDVSGNRIIMHLKTGKVTYHPNTDIIFGEL